MRIIYSLAKFAVFQSFCITNGKLINSLIIWLSISHFGICNAKWLKNGKLRKAILSAFYNISQRNFGILLILWCSFKLWWNFCSDLSRSKFHSKGERSINYKICKNWIMETMHNYSYIWLIYSRLSLLGGRVWACFILIVECIFYNDLKEQYKT
jgi:hypothetical protein